MNSSKIKIITIYFQPFKKLNHKQYLPIQSGKKQTGIELDMQGDDEGDNISELKSFGEFTSVYWAWKHLSQDIDIVGINHYRRFFDFYKIGNPYYYYTNVPLDYFESLNLDVPQNILQFVKSRGVIVSKRRYLRKSVGLQYCETHYSQHLYKVKDIISQLYGESGLSAYKEVINDRNYLFSCNLTLMRRDLFDEYCAWLFPILFKVYEESKNYPLPGYDVRTEAFLGERLWNVFLVQRKLKVKEIPFLIIDPNIKGQGPVKFSKIKCLRHYISDMRLKWSWKLYHKLTKF